MIDTSDIELEGMKATSFVASVDTNLLHRYSVGRRPSNVIRDQCDEGSRETETTGDYHLSFVTMSSEGSIKKESLANLCVLTVSISSVPYVIRISLEMPIGSVLGQLSCAHHSSWGQPSSVMASTS